MAEEDVKDTSVTDSTGGGEQQQQPQGEVVVDNNTNITIETKSENTLSEGVENDGDKAEDKKPEPTGQDPDGNLQQRIDAQQQANNDLKNDLVSKGIDWNVLTKEYEDTGDLSEQSRAALEKAGYPKSVVDAYIRGMEAENERVANRVIEYGGGRDKFVQLQNFAASQSDEYKKMWNDTINSGNLLAIRTMLAGVRLDMEAVQGTQNPTITGKGSSAGSGDGTGFSSKKEMIKAMSDPRYGKDKAYTHEIERKVMKSTNLF